MLLLFTDLVAKRHTSRSITFQDSLTYTICAVEDIVAIIFVTLLDRMALRGHFINVVQLIATIVRLVVILIYLTLDDYSSCNIRDSASEPIMDGVREQQNGGYGTITPRVGTDLTQKTQMETSPRTSSIKYRQLLSYTWYVTRHGAATQV